MKKKASIRERMENQLKSADQVRQPETMYKPPNRGKQTAGAVFLWLLILSMVFLSFRSHMFVMNSQEEEVIEEVENLAAGPEAIEFAKLYAATFFTWKAETESFIARAEALEPMMSEDLDENAGLQVTKVEWNSSLKSARVVEVEEVGEHKTHITLAIEQNLSKGDDKASSETLFIVPVGYAETFGVYDLPSFAASDKQTAVKSDKLKGESVIAETEQNIKGFLETFFESYTTDGPDKLSYFLEDPENSKGLEGAFVFSKVGQTTVLQKEPGIYNVSTNITIADAKTNIEYLVSYRLTVKEENGRYIVTQLKGGL